MVNECNFLAKDATLRQKSLRSKLNIFITTITVVGFAAGEKKSMLTERECSRVV